MLAFVLGFGAGFAVCAAAIAAIGYVAARHMTGSL